MTIGDIFPVAGVIILAIGLAVTWIRNGRGQAKRDGAIEEKINGLSKRLEDKDNGLSAIKKSVDEQRVHCAGITSSFKERLKDLERD